MVVNNAKVIPARLLGRRVKPMADGLTQSSPADGEIEVLLSRQLDDATWDALVRPGKKLHVGQRVRFGGGELEAEVIAHGNQGQRTLRFSSIRGATVNVEIHRLGHIPLPPYAGMTLVLFTTINSSPRKRPGRSVKKRSSFTPELRSSTSIREPSRLSSGCCAICWAGST